MQDAWQLASRMYFLPFFICATSYYLVIFSLHVNFVRNQNISISIRFIEKSINIHNAKLIFDVVDVNNF